MARSSVEESLHAAYSAVRGDAMTKALSGMTLGDLLQEQVDLIQGSPSTKRVAKLMRLTTLEAHVDAVVAGLESEESL